jgi:hypothetical protein
VQKYVDVAYRNFDVEIPDGMTALFEYLKPLVRVEYTDISTDGVPYMDSNTWGSRPVQAFSAFSLCGGATRDMLFGAKVNDFDLVLPGMENLREAGAYTSGKLSVERSHEDHPHHKFLYKIHEEDAGHMVRVTKEYVDFHPIDDFCVVSDDPITDVVITPGRFDFTINEIHMNDRGQFFATPRTWFDFDNKILRLNMGRGVTSNVAIRMIRLAAKCHLNIDVNTVKYVAYKFSKGFVNEHTIQKQVQKCVEDGVGDVCFDWLTKLGYPKIQKYKDINEFLEAIDNGIKWGRAIEKESRHPNYEPGF